MPFNILFDFEKRFDYQSMSFYPPPDVPDSEGWVRFALSERKGVPFLTEHIKNCSEKKFLSFLAASPDLDWEYINIARPEELEKFRTKDDDPVLYVNGYLYVWNDNNDLKGEHEKVINENRILKRAVAIQQEKFQ